MARPLQRTPPRRGGVSRRFDAEHSVLFCGTAMQIRVISLPSAHARREQARVQLTAAGVPFRFFDASDGRAAPTQLSPPVDRLRYLVVSRRAPLPGEIGCYVSHRAMWQYCVELGEPVLVLEDDFRLSPNFAAALDTVHALTREFGFVRLESLYRPPRRASLRPRVPVHRVCERNGLTLYYVADVPTSMIGYAVAPPAAAALFEASAPLAAPVDRFVQRTWLHGVPVFGVEPSLVGPAPIAASSTIGPRSRSRNPLLMMARVLDGAWGQVHRRRFNRFQLARLGHRGRTDIGVAALDLAARTSAAMPTGTKRGA